MKQVMEGQVSIFDFLKTIEEPKVMKDYLSKEERIISIAREKQLKKISFKKNSFMELFNMNALCKKKTDAEKYEYIMTQIRKHIVRPMFEDGMTEENAVSRCRELLGETMDNMDVSVIRKGSVPERILKSFFRKKGTYAGGLCIGGFHIPFGEKCRLSKSQHARRYRLVTDRDYYHIADAGMFLAPLVLLRNLRTTILSAIEGKDKISQMDYPAANYIISSVWENVSKNTKDGVVKIEAKVEKYGFAMQYFANHGLETRVEEKSSWMNCLKLEDMLPLFFVDKDITGSIIFEFAASPHMMQKILPVFELLFEGYITDKEEDAYEKTEKKDYALSFQTKKNIPKSILEAMESSAFNRYFGYVEFDEDTDLALAAELEKEWEAVAGFMEFSSTKEAMLRFRRLGNHRAAGLYYAAYNCICIDINNPSSMLHEYMHMMDYQCGRLSKNTAFHGIRARYSEILRNNVNKDKAIAGVLKGKYNLSYYLMPTEIFARCGEIYATRCLGIKNSLVKPDGGFAYPEDKELTESIRQYYDTFLGLSSSKICLK